MYGDITLQQMQMTGPATADNLRREAAQQFWRARISGTFQQVFARLTGRATQPADLNEVAAQNQVTGRRHIGLQTVNLNNIIGSEGRSHDFDSQFRPVATHLRDRWISILMASFQGVVLPPISLVKLGDGYFVRDGNHRVSVARFLGQNHIDAEVTVWETA